MGFAHTVHDRVNTLDCFVCCRVEHIVFRNAATWPLVFDETTAVHVLQPDEVFQPKQLQQAPSATKTPPKVGRLDVYRCAAQ